MTDYPKALAAAREALTFFDSAPNGSFADQAAQLDCVGTLRNLLAALEFARTTAVAKHCRWRPSGHAEFSEWFYDPLQTTDGWASRARAAGHEVEVRDLFAAPPAALAVPARYVPLAAAEALALEAMRVGNLGGHERTVEGHWSAEVGDRFEEFMFEEGFAMLAAAPAQQPAAGVPDGYALVPVADLESLAFTDFGRAFWTDGAEAAALRIRAMLAAPAAPAAPAAAKNPKEK